MHSFVIQFILNIYLEKWRIYIWIFGFILIGNLACTYFKHCNRNDHDWVGNFKSGRYEVYGDLLPQAIINNNFNYFKK